MSTLQTFLMDFGDHHPRCPTTAPENGMEEEEQRTKKEGRKKTGIHN